MFKKEIKFIYDFNLNEIKKLGNYITYNQLLTANIHPAILQYISADIDYLIFEDRQKILSNSIFDYSSEKIQQQFSIIGEEIRRTKRFSLEYMSKLILHASSFTVNFVSRPKWALLKFIFEDANHKNTTEIKQILNYLYYYGHLRRVIVSYINKKKILSINEKEFEELLDKIDSISVESNARTIVQSSLKAMADFFNIGENSQRSTIPLKAVELFLEEKKFDGHLNRLKSEFGEEDKRIGLIDCLKILDEEMYSKVDEVVMTATSDIQDEIETEIPIEAESEVTEEEIIELEIPKSSEPEIQEPEEETFEEGFTIVKTGSTDDRSELISPEQDSQEEVESEFENELEKLSDEISTEKEIDERESSVPIEDSIDLKETETVKDESTDAEPEVKPFSFMDGEEASLPIDDGDESIVENEAPISIENLVEEKPEITKDHVKEFDLDLFDDYENNDSAEIEEKQSAPVLDKMVDDYDSEEPMEVRDELLSEEEPDAATIESEDRDLNTDNEQQNIRTRLTGLIKVVDEPDNEMMEKEAEEDEVVFQEEEVVEEDKLDKEEELVEEDDEETEETNGKSEKASELSYSDSADTLDISEILENKNLTKVIEVVFDYDIEDFALTIENACKAESFDAGVRYLEEVLKKNHIDTDSKEADALKSVIAEYFNQTK